MLFILNEYKKKGSKSRTNLEIPWTTWHFLVETRPGKMPDILLCWRYRLFLWICKRNVADLVYLDQHWNIAAAGKWVERKDESEMVDLQRAAEISWVFIDVNCFIGVSSVQRVESRKID